MKDANITDYNIVKLASTTPTQAEEQEGYARAQQAIADHEAQTAPRTVMQTKALPMVVETRYQISTGA